MLKDRLLSM